MTGEVSKLRQQKRAALYVRVSTEEQAEHGFSVDAQLKALREHCRQHRRVVFREYVDAGASGGSTEGRPALRELLRDAKDGLFDELLVWKSSRLARNLPLLLETLETLRGFGVSFMSLTERFDTTPMGNFTLQMMGAVAELERKSIAETVRHGMRQKICQGLYCGGQVFGYDYKKAEAGRTVLTPNPTEAAVVRLVFDLFTQGKGLKAIVNYLNGEGHRSKTGKYFSLATVSKILGNPLYAGKVKVPPLPSGQDGPVVLVKGVHEAIVPPELWVRVQTMREKKSRPPSKSVDYDYLLSGLLRCPVCGRGMVPIHATRHLRSGEPRTLHYYACASYLNYGASVCRPNSVRADLVEAVVLEHLAGFLTSPLVVADVSARAEAKLRAGQAQDKDSLAKAEAAVCAVSEEQRKVLLQFEEGTIDKEHLLNKLKTLESCQRAARERVKMAQSGSSNRTTPRTQKKLKNLEKTLQQALASADTGQKRRLLRLAVDKVTIGSDRSPESIRIQLKDFESGQTGFPRHTNSLPG